MSRRRRRRRARWTRRAKRQLTGLIVFLLIVAAVPLAYFGIDYVLNSPDGWFASAPQEGGQQTPGPSPTPGQTPAPNDPDPTPEPEPEPTPEPTTPPWELFHPHSLPGTDPNTNLGFQWRTEIVGDLGEMWFGMPEDYAALAGVTTFRSNNFRQNASWGTATVEREELRINYELTVGSLAGWPGIGWSGQPAIVQWDFEVQQMMNIVPEFRDRRDLVEVIQVALDGNIYFFEAETGVRTRPPINAGAPLKGGAVIDPRGYPILYVGHGIQNGPRFGYFIFSLIDGSELFFLSGADPFAPRNWPAFDSNPLIDGVADRMLLCGENGVIYNILLNTRFDRTAGTVSLDPVVSRFRYTTNPHRRVYGIESSPAAFGHYLFTADNSGIILCMDLRTFEPVWVFDARDDTDATLVLDWEEEYERLVIFTGTQVDLQGPGGIAMIRKLDASNGEVLWEWSIPCRHVALVNGGVMATPILGQGDISDLVIFNVAKTLGIDADGLLIAFDRMTGDVVWEVPLPRYAWSSPVAVYTEDGTSYILMADSVGMMRLFRGTTGEVLYRLNLHTNVEASPAVFGNMVVVGTRGQRIFGIEIL